MITETTLFSSYSAAIDGIKMEEADGWAVRQIFPTGIASVLIVVFEREKEEEFANG